MPKGQRCISSPLIPRLSVVEPRYRAAAPPDGPSLTDSDFRRHRPSAQQRRDGFVGDGDRRQLRQRGTTHRARVCAESRR